MQAPYIPDSTLSADSFHSRASLGTVFKMIPSYGKHFTQSPSLQPRLFLDCNPICLIFKVLASFRFLFIRSSVASDSLIRSNLLYNSPNPCYIKIMHQKYKLMTSRLILAIHPDVRLSAERWASRETANN